MSKKIKPVILTYGELIDKLNNSGSVKVTINGNIQLNDYIGIQMKGSGKGTHYHSLQFKDRGYKKFIYQKNI